ncbi:MFS transporter [Streptomyces sp. NPDC020719]|uniref:MFS transporter n=1 Tax=Streptomyces sp. NPDC020719 TaxID=3154896 RepID=UPI003404630C
MTVDHGRTVEAARVGTGPLITRNSGFARVWGAQLLSQSATRMYQMGMLWWVLGQVVAGERGMASGIFLACAALPPVLFAPWIGRVVAAHPSGRVLRGAVVAAAAIGLVLAVVALVARLPLVAVYPGMLALASCQALFDPCLTKAIPELVDDADIENATAFEQSTFSLVGMAGAVLGAVLVGVAGPSLVVATSAAAYLAAAAVLGPVRFRPVESPEADADAPAGVLRTWRMLASRPFIRIALVCFAAANFFITATFVVLPLYTKDALAAPSTTLGLLEGALWLGMLLGTFSGARLPGSPSRIGAVCVALFGAALVVPGLVADRTVFLLCLLVAGWAVGATNVVFVALFQRTVPTSAKPAFFATMLALLGASFPLASLVFGVAGDLFGPQTLCLIQAVGLPPIALVLWLRSGRAAEAARAGAEEPRI